MKIKSKSYSKTNKQKNCPKRKLNAKNVEMIKHTSSKGKPDQQMKHQRCFSPVLSVAISGTKIDVFNMKMVNKYQS